MAAIEKFCSACVNGDEEEAERLIEQDPSLLNHQDPDLG